MAKKAKIVTDEAEEDTSAEVNTADANTPQEEKVDFKVLTEGAIIDGEAYKVGDTIALTRSEARGHTDRDVRLEEVA